MSHLITPLALPHVPHLPCLPHSLRFAPLECPTCPIHLTPLGLRYDHARMPRPHDSEKGLATLFTQTVQADRRERKRHNAVQNLCRMNQRARMPRLQFRFFQLHFLLVEAPCDQRHAEAKTPLKGVCARAREHVSMQDGWVDLRVDVCTCV